MGKIRSNETGFSIIEIVLVFIVIGLIGTVSYMVYKNRHRTSPTPVTATTQTANPQTKTTKAPSPTVKKATNYDFKELGISMDLAPGWEVSSNPTQDGSVNFYSWTVSKAGSDGKITLASSGFRGGFEECMLTPATIKEVTPTQNPKLLFMSWSYTTDKTSYQISLVPSDEEVFKTANVETATPIKNSTTKPGNYFFCLGYPTPGFSLGLNQEPAPGYSRRDYVYAQSATSNDFLTPTAQSYADITSMLSSIK